MRRATGLAGDLYWLRQVTDALGPSDQTPYTSYSNNE
jgi:hypothetical protein